MFQDDLANQAILMGQINLDRTFLLFAFHFHQQPSDVVIFFSPAADR
jgi:hypothetical protein